MEFLDGAKDAVGRLALDAGNSIEFAHQQVTRCNRDAADAHGHLTILINRLTHDRTASRCWLAFPPNISRGVRLAPGVSSAER